MCLSIITSSNELFHSDDISRQYELLQARTRLTPVARRLPTTTTTPLPPLPDFVGEGKCESNRPRHRATTRIRPSSATASQAGACMVAKAYFFPFTQRVNSLGHSPTVIHALPCTRVHENRAFLIFQAYRAIFMGESYHDTRRMKNCS